MEVPLYWQIIDGPHFDLRRTGLLNLPEKAGVHMHAGSAALDLAPPFDIFGLPVSNEALDFNIASAKRVIDLRAELRLELVQLVEPNV